MGSFISFIRSLRSYKRTFIVFLSFALILLNSYINVLSTTYIADASFSSRVQFGTAITSQELLNPTVTNTLYDYGFHQLTPGYEAKMDTIKPTRDTDNYAPFDRIVDYALSHSMTVHGHTLVWNEEIPAWLTSSNLSKDDYKTILNDYITKTMSRYCGRVPTWDVVNEALNGSGGLNTDNFWYQKIGAEYFPLSYQWAHQACPSAKLYYNDTGIENKGSASDGVYNMILNLRSQGIRIDGVGLQTHDGGGFGYVNASSMKENMDRFAAIGVEVAISEMDEQLGTSTPDTDQLNAQASRYRQVATACVEASNCVRFTVWGLSDNTSWIRNDAPLLFDGNYQPKPAYWAVREALTGQSATPPTQPVQPPQPPQPVQPASPNIIGSEDDMRSNTLRGWACDTNNPSSTISVSFFTENGTLVGQAQANQPGEDGIAALCSGYANHRFTLPLPAFLIDGQPHTIYAKAQLGDGTFVPLTFNSSQTIQVGNQTAPAIPAPTTGGDLTGYHDEIQGNMTYGWACDPDDYNQALRVDFYADGNGFGTFLGSVYAGDTRESAVGNLCGGNSSHGFTFTLPESLNDGQPHTIYAYGINIGTGVAYKLLGNSPKFYQAASAQPAAAPQTPTNGNVTIEFVSKDCPDALMRFSF